MARPLKVRTTIRPHKVIEVGDAELLDLTRQGLIHSHEDREGLKSPHKWEPASKGELEKTGDGIITGATTERTGE